MNEFIKETSGGDVKDMQIQSLHENHILIWTS